MNWTEQLTRYVCNFVDELATSGMENVVISPGSRSTPLALAFAEHNGIKEWVLVDERSAAFFALGLAKSTGKPVAIICTSGTAAANYYPAIIEAFYSQVPLVVLTADRPNELRDVDAPQAIDQMRMYGGYTKWFHEMALPEGSSRMQHYARSKAARALHTSIAESGPVHLNFPFREPLVLDFELDGIWGTDNEESFYPVVGSKHELTNEQLELFIKKLEPFDKGLLVAGPGIDQQTAKALLELSRKWKMPILADPLSQLRQVAGEDAFCVIETYDALFKTETMRKKLKPDFIIRFGAMPVSKTYRFFIEEHAQEKQFIVSDDLHFREPTGNRTSFIQTNPERFALQLTNFLQEPNVDSTWLSMWGQLNREAKLILSRKDNVFTEGSVVLELTKRLPKQTVLFSGNSMAIRDLDTFMFTGNEEFRVMANRGANGIDGVISSACGVAASGQRTTLLIGDLSFYHDMNGLFAAKHYHLPLTIILVNNGGGGIFSFLPQAGDKSHFEALFGTPLNLDFAHVGALYGASYAQIDNAIDFAKALYTSYENEGLSIIEVRTDRFENEQWHRSKWQEVNEKILPQE